MTRQRSLNASVKNVEKSSNKRMIDRIARNILFDQLRKVATGKITGFACENVLLSLQNEDRVVDALRRTLGELIDEKDTSLKAIFAKKSEMRSRIARWLMFLKSDCDYQWPNEKLPSGILDFYKPTLLDRLTGASARNQTRISEFMKAGDYQYWPFTSKCEFDHAKCGGIIRRGLRLVATDL